MRLRSTVTAIATAAILTTTAITPANAFTEVYTDDAPKSCIYISDDNLSPIYDYSFGFYQLLDEMTEEAQNLPFAKDIHEWRAQNPEVNVNTLHESDLPVDITKKMADSGFEEYEYLRLLYLIIDKGVMSRHVGNLLSRQLPALPDSEENKSRQHFVKKISREKYSAEQAKAKESDLTSGANYLSSTAPESTPDPTAPNSKAFDNLLETSFAEVKPQLMYAKKAFSESTYDNYITAFNKRHDSVTAASSACKQWINGEISQDAIPHFAGTKEAYTQRLTSLHTFIGPRTPSDSDPQDSNTPAPQPDSSSSTSGIILITMALLAVIGGIGAWISGLIPGLPHPHINR